MTFYLPEKPWPLSDGQGPLSEDLPWSVVTMSRAEVHFTPDFNLIHSKTQHFQSGLLYLTIPPRRISPLLTITITIITPDNLNTSFLFLFILLRTLRTLLYSNNT